MEQFKEKYEEYIKPLVKKWTDKIGAEKIEQVQKISKMLSIVQMASLSAITLCKLYRSMARPGKNLSKRYGKGTWVAITGASAGIGKGFAQNFAAKGFNIVLIARNKDKLDSVAAEIEATYKVKTMVLVLDFSTCTRFEDYESVLLELNRVDVSILVNNVGYGNTVKFLNLSYEHLQHLVSINMLGQLYFTRFLLPKMVLRKQRSAIINVSSLFTAIPRIPYMQMYVATKSFNSMFSQCLSEEYESKIDVMALHPGPVHTQLTDRTEHLNTATITSKDYTKSVLNDLGYETFTCGTTSFNVSYLVIDFLSNNPLFKGMMRTSLTHALAFSEEKKFSQTSF